MNIVRLTLCLSLFLSINVMAFQVNAFNLKVGDTYKVKVNESQVITQTAGSLSNKIITEIESIELLKVEDITQEGDYVIALTILELKTVVASPVMSIVEDTENENIGTGLYPALKNSTYRFQMSNKGEIIRIIDLEDLKGQLKSELRSNRQARGQIELLLSEEAVISNLKQRLSYFPETEKMKWSVNKDMDMYSMLVSVDSEYSYKNDYTINSSGTMSVNSSIDLFGTTTQVELTGSINATYTLNRLSGVPYTILSSNNISGNALAMGISIPMTFKTETKTTFSKQY